MVLNVLGVCGGNGVILYPFRKYLIANVEPRSLFKTPGNEQWEANFDDIPLVNEPTFEKCWAEMLGNFLLPSIEVIIGAPDCGDSSILSYSRNKKLGNPKDNLSLLLYFEFVERLQPKVWLMENLPKLLETITQKDFEEKFPNYTLIFNMASVSAWGNSQLSRVRLVIIGIRKDVFTTELGRAMARPYKVRTLKTSGQLISNLGNSTGQITEDINGEITLYAGFKDKISNIMGVWNTTLKNKKRWIVTDRKFTTAPGVYKNLENEPPATARKANRQFNHKGQMMSPRELARIQGIPDSFILVDDKSRLNFWINKGRVTCTKTPPMEISRWFKLQLWKHLKHPQTGSLKGQNTQ